VTAALPPACASCGAPIRWVTTSGRASMPLDFNPDPAGNVEVIADLFGNLTAAVLGPVKAAVRRRLGVTLYRCHFATCPHSAAWKRAR
jgi:hypothetical protein